MDDQVFYVDELTAAYNRNNADHANDYTIFQAGWYWTDEVGEWFGPFKTKKEAQDDMESGEIEE